MKISRTVMQRIKGSKGKGASAMRKRAKTSGRAKRGYTKDKGK